MKSTRASAFFQFATIGLAIAFLFTGALGHGLNPGWLFAAAAMLTALLSLYARYPGMRGWHVALAFAVVLAAGLLLLTADPVLTRVLAGVAIALVLPVTAGIAWRRWA
jgi:hypothetical protein